MITNIIQEHKMSFFDKINNYLMVNAIKEILKGRDPDESLPDSGLRRRRAWVQIAVATLSGNSLR